MDAGEVIHGGRGGFWCWLPVKVYIGVLGCCLCGARV